MNIAHLYTNSFDFKDIVGKFTSIQVSKVKTSLYRLLPCVNSSFLALLRKNKHFLTSCSADN